MTLTFKSFTYVSLYPDNPLGRHGGYNFLETLQHGFLQVRPAGSHGSGVSYAAQDAGITNYRYDIDNPPTTLPHYVTDGTTHEDNKLVPGEAAIVTAVIYNRPNSTTEMVDVPGRLWGKAKKQVVTPLPPTKSLVVQFDMDAMDYTQRHAGSIIQLQVEEPTDPAQRREFAELERRLRDISSHTTHAFEVGAMPEDVLIHPTVINTRVSGGPSPLRADVLLGMLERTNRIIRGTLPPDSPVEFGAEQLTTRLLNEINPPKHGASVEPRQPPLQWFNAPVLAQAVHEAAGTDREMGPHLRTISSAVDTIGFSQTNTEDLLRIRTALRFINQRRSDGLEDPAANTALNGVRKFLKMHSDHLPEDLDAETVRERAGARTVAPDTFNSGGTTEAKRLNR